MIDITTKIYRGIRNMVEGFPRGKCVVTVTGVPLEDRWGEGFDWGYRAPLGVNLAFAIMMDYFEDANVPEEICQIFFDDVVSKFPTEKNWTITGEQISKWIYRRLQEGKSDEEAELDYKDAESITIFDDPAPLPSSPKLETKQSQKMTAIVEDDEDEDEDEDEDVLVERPNRFMINDKG